MVNELRLINIRTKPIVQLSAIRRLSTPGLKFAGRSPLSTNFLKTFCKRQSSSTLAHVLEKVPTTVGYSPFLFYFALATPTITPSTKVYKHSKRTRAGK